MGVSSLEQRSMYVGNTIEERERELYLILNLSSGDGSYIIYHINNCVISTPNYTHRGCMITRHW